MRQFFNSRRIRIRVTGFILLALALTARPISCPAEEKAADADVPVLTVATTRFGVPNIMDVDIHGSRAVQLTKDPKGAVSPAWSPDGKRLLFISYRDGGGQIFVMNADGSGETNVSNGAFKDRNPSWFPDSKKIIFSSTRDKPENLWTVNADGSQLVNHNPQKYQEGDPVPSPDGKRLAMASNRTGKKRLWVTNLDGSEPLDLIKKDQSGKVQPAWSPDGKQLVFGQNDEKGKVQLFAINADGTGVVQITRAPEGLQCSFGAWSPDGQYIAYVRFKNWPKGTEPDPEVESVAPPGDLMVYNMVDDTHTAVTTGDVDMWGPRPCWRPKVASVEIPKAK